jgi:hypothetical protein
MAGVREWVNGPGGKIVGIVATLLLLGVLVFAVRNTFGPSEAEAHSRNRWFVDAKTGQPFKFELTAGVQVPVAAPSGGNTGYPAELCFWTKDGKPKTEPTPVLLNSMVGKTGPTFCPDCGRLVTGHNPIPMEGRPAPPTEAEYKAKASSNQNDRD